jgi:hypothetical protein
MQRKEISRLTKEFNTLIASFAQVHKISIRDNTSRPEPGNEAVAFHVVLAPTPTANEVWVGRRVKTQQTEQVVSLLFDLHEPEARTVMGLYESGRLFIGSSPYLKTRGWLGRVVGRATKTRMLEADMLFYEGEAQSEPPRHRHYADPSKVMVPSDCGLCEPPAIGDRVWFTYEDGLVYRGRVNRTHASTVSIIWLDWPDAPAEHIDRSHILVPLALS